MEEDPNYLIFAILRHFEEELISSRLDPDAKEALEVASQCVENAYKVNCSDAEVQQKYPLPASLPEIFMAGLKVKSEENKPKQLTDEEKANADRFKNQGNAKMKEEQYTEAVKCYTDAIAIDNSNAVYFSNRAAAYSKQGDHNLALGDCNRALQIDPTYSKAYGRKGLAHSALNQHQEAMKSFEKALELDPANESYKKNLEVSEKKFSEQQAAGPGMGGNPGMGGLPGLSGIPGMGGLPGMGPGGMDFSQVLNNPAFMNMATQMMSNPDMQQMMSSLMANMGGMGAQGGEAGGSPDMATLMQAGQQFAQQMQQSNPELIEQFRQASGGSQGPSDESPAGGENGGSTS